MNNKKTSVAEEFRIYRELPWLDRWSFRRSLRWIRQDPASLEVLLAFEKQLQEKSFFWWQTYGHIQRALRWYNREYHGKLSTAPLPDPLPLSKLPALLQLVCFFIARNQKPNYAYRELFLNILRFSETVGRDPQAGATVTPERFRLEIADIICYFNDKWHNWNGWYPERRDSADQMLAHFANIARRVPDLHLFTQFRIEVEKTSSFERMNVGEMFACLESIANKVEDLPTCQAVFQETVPLLGLEFTSSLMDLSKDFQEFETFFHRVVPQLEYWGRGTISLFGQLQNGAELDRALFFLETAESHPLMRKCVQYHESMNPPGGALLLKPVTEVKEILVNGS